MSEIASQITSLTIVYSTVLSGADQSKHQSSASLAFVWEIHRWPVNFPHKWPVTRKRFPFDDVIMNQITERPPHLWMKSCVQQHPRPEWSLRLDCFGKKYICYENQTLRWRHNDHAGVSNHQPHGCLLNRLFRRNSKKTSKLRVTGLCAGNSPGTGEFPAQMASYEENVSIWWRHHER